MLKFRAVPRRLFSYGKPSHVEDWELARVVGDAQKPTPPTTEKFTKSFQEYLDTRLTLDEIMKKSVSSDNELLRKKWGVV